MALKAGWGDWLARPATRAAIVLAIVGVLFVLVEAQSPSRVYWTGEAVHGMNSGGIVYFRVHGEEWTLDAPGPAPAHDTPVTVYVDPRDPGSALLLRPTRWIEAVSVLAWFVTAAGLMIVPPLRRARRRRIGLRTPGESESEWISRYAARPPTMSRDINQSG
jgi:hypothetical protein